VSIDRLAPTLPLAVLVAEDERFCSPPWDRPGRKSTPPSRQPTISAKRVAARPSRSRPRRIWFLWPGRSFVRKALEFPLALWIDLVLPKRRIMEIYLNIAQWGPNGEFGAEAGARAAFGKSAADLDLREAPCWLQPCPIRCGATRAGRARACAGSPPSTRPAPVAPPRSPSV